MKESECGLRSLWLLHPGDAVAELCLCQCLCHLSVFSLIWKTQQRVIAFQSFLPCQKSGILLNFCFTSSLFKPEKWFANWKEHRTTSARREVCLSGRETARDYQLGWGACRLQFAEGACKYLIKPQRWLPWKNHAEFEKGRIKEKNKTFVQVFKKAGGSGSQMDAVAVSSPVKHVIW